MGKSRNGRNHTSGRGLAAAASVLATVLLLGVLWPASGATAAGTVDSESPIFGCAGLMTVANVDCAFSTHDSFGSSSRSAAVGELPGQAPWCASEPDLTRYGCANKGSLPVVDRCNLTYGCDDGAELAGWCDGALDMTRYGCVGGVVSSVIAVAHSPALHADPLMAGAIFLGHEASAGTTGG